MKKLTRTVTSETHADRHYPVGTPLVLLERLGPDAWLGEVAIEDQSVVGGHTFDTVLVRRADYEDMEGEP